MQDRVLRFLDKQGRITISIIYRGNQLDGEVELISGAGGIKIIPFSGDGRGKCIRKFDVKDRLQIPSAMRTMFKMGEAVEVLRNDDGSLFLRIPKEMCSLCGSIEDVHKLEDKWICGACLSKIHYKLLGSTDE